MLRGLRMACVNDVDFASFAERLAEVSSEVILPFFRSEIGADDKSDGGDFDPVTEADRAAEVVMRHLIRETFPDHGIIGEEYGAERSEADHVWVLDPIDGTKSFISGLPTWGTLIGLMKFGQPVYGMMSQPFTRERYFGDNLCSRRRWVTPSRGDSANGEWSSRVLRSRACASLTQASLMTTSPLLFNEQDRAAYRRLEKVARLVRYGGDCYAYCMLASGFVDVIVETNLKPYDIVALVPIITGVGGVVSNWEGGPAALGGRIVAVRDPRLHAAVLALLAG
jgi:histidinol phosphatase-like enzyme (inositol monophosphatase family)